MVSEQPTRRVLKLLRKAGWEPVRSVGSHTVWRSADGTRSLSIPDGHTMISPGIVRQVHRALKEGQE
jgi:predicted RNA binding protein YcfA (HicA-like mRNA interferase family)